MNLKLLALMPEVGERQAGDQLEPNDTSESGLSRGTAAGPHSRIPMLEFGVCCQNRHGEICFLSR